MDGSRDSFVADIVHNTQKPKRKYAVMRILEFTRNGWKDELAKREGISEFAKQKLQSGLGAVFGKRPLPKVTRAEFDQIMREVYFIRFDDGTAFLLHYRKPHLVLIDETE